MLPLPVSVKWDDSCHNCIYFAIQGGWVWQDFETAMQEAHHLSDTAEHPYFYYIFDVRGTRIFPRDGLHKIRRMRPQIHEKTRMILVLGQGIFADALIQLLETASIKTGTRIKQVNILDEAYSLIDADKVAESR